MSSHVESHPLSGILLKQIHTDASKVLIISHVNKEQPYLQRFSYHLLDGVGSLFNMRKLIYNLTPATIWSTWNIKPFDLVLPLENLLLPLPAVFTVLAFLGMSRKQLLHLRCLKTCKSYLSNPKKKKCKSSSFSRDSRNNAMRYICSNPNVIKPNMRGKKRKTNMRGLMVKEFRRPKGQCGTIGKFTWKILSKSG